MNKKEQKRHDQDMHALRINRAAWLAWSAAENTRWSNAKVRELLEVMDNVSKALIESFEQNKICSVRVDFWTTGMLPGFQEALEEEQFDGMGDFIPRAEADELERIKEALRRQQLGDISY